jgi:hypothetical protein
VEIPRENPCIYANLKCDSHYSLLEKWGTMSCTALEPLGSHMENMTRFKYFQMKTEKNQTPIPF